jgi:hypothetical protein
MIKWPEVINGVLARQVRLFGYDVRTGRDNQAKIDSILHGLPMIDALHSKTHEGIAYEISADFPNVAAGASALVLIRTGNRHAAHLRPTFFSEGAAHMYLFEGTTVSADGTSKAVINKNRAWGGPANLTAFTGPTVTGDGTKLTEFPVYSATGPGQTSSGGSAGTFEEWVLKNDTNYLVRITNNHPSDAKDLFLNLTFYEQELRL